MQRTDEKEMLDALQKLSKKLNTNNISKSMIDADRNTLSSITYRRVFGSWGRACELAGLKTGKITGRPWDEAISLSNSALEIFDGELLGDGSLEQTPTSGNPGFIHSTTNFYYSIYLEQKLLEAGINVSVELLPSRNNGKPQRRIRTQYNQALRPLLSCWYPNGIKIIPGNLELNKTKCMHWFLGDGYIEGKNVKFSTCSFSWDEVYKLGEMIKMLGFETAVGSHSGGYPILRILPKNSQEFLNWLGPCPVIGYEHKWNL